MATVETIPWDPADSIETRQDAADYLEAVYDDEGPDGILDDALGDIKRAMDRCGFAANWGGVNSPLGAYIRQESQKSLDSYRSQPNLVAEHANTEEDTARGGYANRQLVELVQNSADALSKSDGEHIWVRLTPTHLYCADNGRPIDRDGARALLFSHLSSRRGTSEIGRFGLGFKSVLGVTDAPEFFSHSGSFRFDRQRSAEQLSPIAPKLDRYPVLRMAAPIVPESEFEADRHLREMSYWASNIVRLPLKPRAHAALAKQIADFPAEFLLFVEHVGRLVLQADDTEPLRVITLARQDDEWILQDAGTESRWLVESRLHQLSSDAKADSRSLDNADEVPIWWAVPLDRLNEPGKFWAFFPTLTQSLVPGILNAPWKTNEDRQNLLEGTFNKESIEAAASMVADVLPRLATEDDPARHLDALPRRREAGDNDHADHLRDSLYERLRNADIVPDQSGALRNATDLSYAPSMLLTQEGRQALDRWAEFEHKPIDWAHHRALLTRNRVARLDVLCPMRAIQRWSGSVRSVRYETGIPKTSIAQWLEALVDNAEPHTLEASKAAIQTAALIPFSIRNRESLGRILITEDEDFIDAESNTVRLREGSVTSTGIFVHPELEEDPKTLVALKELGLRPTTPETAFRDLFPRLHMSTNDWNGFWELSRVLEPSVAFEITKSQNRFQTPICVRTLDMRWTSFAYVLLPGPIVPTDGSRDSSVAIDTDFHRDDLPLLNLLGAVGAPQSGYEVNPWRYLSHCRSKFASPDRNLPRNPRGDLLNFENPTTSGPLEVLSRLSDEGKVLYTDALLSLNDTYKTWTMRHDTQDIYPPMNFPSPAIEVLREHGRVQTDDGAIHKLSDALGDPPANPAVLYKLLSHPKAASIRTAFDISAKVEIPTEPVGADGDSVPLIDVWPGLEPHLSERHANLNVTYCDGFQQPGGFPDGAEPAAVIEDAEGVIYVRRTYDDGAQLQAIVGELGLSLANDQMRMILLGLTDENVKAARDYVREFGSDEARLLAAVGNEFSLRQRLPQSLLQILEQDKGSRLDGEEVARAAIATYHTRALHEYRAHLERLDPPRQWAGRPKAVEFVRSLGFSEEWAGEPRRTRDPYIEVDGPLSLPPLHAYQRKVVENVRSLVRSNGALGPKRGMVSMPTGSGKTRVAVQSIVEAIRDGEYRGGVLWIADRGELCEQAVEAWREVWASEGSQKKRLRISRMWESQLRPLPSSEMHVIVASIQTLYARTQNQPAAYEFLGDFDLVVFDEAHRSITPTSTSVMEEVGLTRWQRQREPILLGLTATPYRGHDESETRRLVNRYSGNRLDAGAFASDNPEAVIRELQSMQVLARADHATIAGGDFRLTAHDLRQQQRQGRNYPWLPASVEERISNDTVRTQRIIAEYFDRIGPDWPTLIFATSVEHSKTVAALLTARGVKARAVSGETDNATRRRVVEEFRSGEVKALVNFNVFREGFDAPKTRAIIVARPVYSPNLYFQMIGRGLRGVENGGNDRCLILNVQDNIENFERKLAFSELDWLWDDAP